MVFTNFFDLLYNLWFDSVEHEISNKNGNSMKIAESLYFLGEFSKSTTCTFFEWLDIKTNLASTQDAPILQVPRDLSLPPYSIGIPAGLSCMIRS